FLAYTLPFYGRDSASTLAKVLHDPPPRLSAFLKKCPRELDQVVFRALAKDRNERYGSMEDFSFELQAVQEVLSRELIVNYLQSAETCVLKQDWNKAKENLRQLLKLDRQHRRANDLLREVQAQIQKQQVNEQLRQLRAHAEEALVLRRWD